MRISSVHAAVAGLVLAVVSQASCVNDGPACRAEDDGTALLQRAEAKADIERDGTSPLALARIKMKDGAYMLGENPVTLLGANYVMKGKPYFPPVDVVKRNAKQIAADFKASDFVKNRDGKAVPCVRLGAMMEGMMPAKKLEFDAAWLQRLEETIEAFAHFGVYVFLDAHSDAWSTTNGGDGFPWWMGAYMQETAEHDESYIVSPEHPLELAISEALANLFPQFGSEVPKVTTVENDTNPWLNFSVGSGVGDPRYMNVGNVNLRKNNNDWVWGTALFFTKQVQNTYYRFFNSFRHPKDRENLFVPYVEFVKRLMKVWERHSNVVAVEIINEPPPSGLPCIEKARESRTTLWSFYAHVLDELDKSGVHPEAAVSLQDIMSSVPGSNRLLDFLFRVGKMRCNEWEMSKLKSWAKAGRMSFSFHYFPGFPMPVGLEEMVTLARDFASSLGPLPVFLSEFFAYDAQEVANTMVQAVDSGSNAVTYWHYADKDFTGQSGWYKYNQATLAKGIPVNDAGEINWEAWNEYVKTVFDGTFFGADITGADNGRTDVLRRLPEKAPPTPAKMRTVSLPNVN
mmetsp:Transcript_1531/g.4138  ORF Transcript_1531/g.4138 Transcript_1531/m.4138 type:complete len:571 (+) Transcript_1531:59-1771(+)